MNVINVNSKGVAVVQQDEQPTYDQILAEYLSQDMYSFGDILDPLKFNPLFTTI